MDRPDNTAAIQAILLELLAEPCEPLRANDLVRGLKGRGVAASKMAVNRVLYHGPFERVDGDGGGRDGAPRWRAREAPAPAPWQPPRIEGYAAAVPLDEAGYLYLLEALSPARRAAIAAAAIAAAALTDADLADG